MCGISGWFQINAKIPIQYSTLAIDSMMATIAHRGPDDRGSMACDAAPPGMTRLSIIDVDGGHQPIASDAEDCCIVFNGYSYNVMHLRTEQ